MTRLKQVSNTQPHIDEKVNYFIDCLNDFITYAGVESDYEIETPVSLMSKIVFQLENNNKQGNNRYTQLPYFDNYFNKGLFTLTDFFDQFASYKRLKSTVDDYRSLSKDKKDRDKKIEIITNSKLLKNLKLFELELKDRMIEVSVTNFIQLLRCEHTLYEQEHNDSLKFYAHLLISEYFHVGRNRSEVRSIIKNVFSKDINLFPFTSDANTKTKKKEVLKRASLNDQLKGFQNAYAADPGSVTVFVKIYGGKLPENFVVKYNNVSFYSLNHPTISRLKSKLHQEDKSAYFATDQCFIAACQITFYSENSLITEATKTIETELQYLSVRLSMNFIVDNSGSYLTVAKNWKRIGYSLWGIEMNKPINQYDLKDINSNPYHILRRINSQAKNWFLEFEPLLVNAMRTNNLSDYWHYLEALLSFGQQTKIQEIVSHAILVNEKFSKQQRILTTLYHSLGFMEGGAELLKADDETHRMTMKNLRKSKISKSIRNSNYPFVKKLTKQFDHKLTNEDFKKAKMYYESLLIELREYRNFYIHNGHTNNHATIKLQLSIPRIVIRLRWAIIDSLKKNKSNIPFGALMEKIVDEGKALTI